MQIAYYIVHCHLNPNGKFSCSYSALEVCFFPVLLPLKEETMMQQILLYSLRKCIGMVEKHTKPLMQKMSILFVIKDVD